MSESKQTWLLRAVLSFVKLSPVRVELVTYPQQRFMNRYVLQNTLISVSFLRILTDFNRFPGWIGNKIHKIAMLLSTRMLTRRSFLSKYLIFSHGKFKCNHICSSKKNTAFSVTTLRKLIILSNITLSNIMLSNITLSNIMLSNIVLSNIMRRSLLKIFSPHIWIWMWKVRISINLPLSLTRCFTATFSRKT